MTRRILCAAAGATVLVLWFGLLLAGMGWLSGWFPPRPLVVTVLVVVAALGLFGGGLMAYPAVDPADPERDAFMAAARMWLDGLDVIDDADRNAHPKESSR